MTAAYMGMIISRKKIAFVPSGGGAGVSAGHIDRIYQPVGLPYVRKRRRNSGFRYGGYRRGQRADLRSALISYTVKQKKKERASIGIFRTYLIFAPIENAKKKCTL